MLNRKFMTKNERKVYDAVVKLKKVFTELHEKGDEQFYEYLIDRDYPERRGYVEYLIKEKILDEELRYPAIEFLIMSIVDINESIDSINYLYEQGNGYFSKWRYMIPSTKKVMREIEHLIIEEEEAETMEYIPSYEDYLYLLERDGVEVTDDFVAGYYKAIELYYDKDV